MLNNKQIHHLQEVLYITIIWIIATFLFVFIKFNDIPENSFPNYFQAGHSVSKTLLFEVSVFVSIPLGLTFGFLHTFIYSRLVRNKNVLVNIIVRSAVFLILSIAILFTITYLDRLHYGINTDNSTGILTRSALLSIFIYMLVTESLISIFITLRRDLGGSYFRNIMVNTYRNPKEEIRVFMFLDMENSTPAVYELGDLSFSRYIQDCFYDLSDIVLEHKGDIYQFVGDEAVITWKVAGKFNYGKCLDLYFSFIDLLESRRGYYQDKYERMPTFRCAIHTGKVSTALVGDYSREIAFHGNVLNLCARLQAVCKENNASVLVSDAFYSSLDSYTQPYKFEPVSILSLKGIPYGQAAYRVSKK